MRCFTNFIDTENFSNQNPIRLQVLVRVSLAYSNNRIDMH